MGRGGGYRLILGSSGGHSGADSQYRRRRIVLANDIEQKGDLMVK